MGTQAQAQQPGKRRRGCGCSPVILLIPVAIFAAFAWPIVLNSIGTTASGVVSGKFESIRIEYGDWFRHFQVTGTYSIPGQPIDRRAVCDVDEKTYDSLRIGGPVTVRYMRNLPPQPFLTTARMAPCSLVGISMGPSVWRLIYAGAILLGVLFVWLALRVRLAIWLLPVWVCFAFVYLGMPRVEPAPRQPVSATATVANITTIDTLWETSQSDGIPLQHAYQVVELRFVPKGMDAPVVAIDKIDDDTSDLKKGQSVAIAYDAGNPRIAQVQAGTRRFPVQAWMTVMLWGAVIGALGLLALGARGLLRMIRRNLPF